MNKFWQTIIFFALISAMVAFIFSAIRPAQYLAESEFLVISDSIEPDCNKNLGDTLARIIVSESFEKDLKNIRDINKKVPTIDSNLKIENYKNSNIVNVKIGETSLSNAQSLSEHIQKTILSQAHKYYSPEDRIRIKTLVNPRIIRTPRVIMENTAKGLIIGAILGMIIALSTGLRLDIARKDKNIGVKQGKKKKKEKKPIYSSNQKKDYKTIIKRRLEKELSKKPIKDLNLTDEEYVFKGIVKDFKKSLAKKKGIEGAIPKKYLVEKIATEKKGSKKQTSEVRVISASTMIVGRHDKEIGKNKIPENLPIFIEEKLSTKDRQQITKKRIVQYDNNKVQQNKNDKRVEKSEKNKIKKVVKNKSKEKKMPGTKKASAHNIANGFAPDIKNTEGPSNEEIKDRLNKLLRGEL